MKSIFLLSNVRRILPYPKKIAKLISIVAVFSQSLTMKCINSCIVQHDVTSNTV